MEYLLLPENEDKIMNNIDKPEIIIIKTRESIELINSDVIGRLGNKSTKGLVNGIGKE